MSFGMSDWFRRGPRLSGSLHIRDATGRELTVPLRGRDTLLTADGSGLPGYGAAWAVHTGPQPDGVSAASGVLLVYGPTGSVDDRRSGICQPGRTITLGGVDFTWITGAGVRVPAPRSPARNTAPALRDPRPRTANTRAEAGLGHRFRNMVRIVTRARVKR
ncbi:MAG TPA: hypothetical protein VN408_34270 [Actinoplanes sp.]|nr:hypothetical protein [Actinoplanes sp.]